MLRVSVFKIHVYPSGVRPLRMYMDINTSLLVCISYLY